MTLVRTLSVKRKETARFKERERHRIGGKKEKKKKGVGIKTNIKRTKEFARRNTTTQLIKRLVDGVEIEVPMTVIPYIAEIEIIGRRYFNNYRLPREEDEATRELLGGLSVKKAPYIRKKPK